MIFYLDFSIPLMGTRFDSKLMASSLLMGTRFYSKLRASDVVAMFNS